jgi:hypothetical protein
MIQGYDNQNIKIDFVILLLKERNLEKYVSSFSSADSEKININKIISTLKSSIEAEEQNNEQAAIDEIDKFILRSVSHLKVEGNGYDAEILPPPSEAEKSEADKNFAEQKRKKITKITNAFQDPLERIIVRSKIEEQPDGPLISLKSLIDEKSRQFIIKKIFDNEMSEYAHFISHLDFIESWKEAKELIDKELILRDVKPFSKEALRLGDLVFNRYFPKKIH